jgi:hypothetical protein
MGIGEFCLHIFLVHPLGALSVFILAFVLNHFRYWWKLGRKFNGACFDVYYKGKDQDEKDKIRTVTLTVCGRKISYLGEQIDKIPGEGVFEGEFIIDILNMRLGNGVHYHKSYHGFNFPRIFIRDDDTFYIQTHYLSNENRENKYEFDIHYQAYIFKRHKTSN